MHYSIENGSADVTWLRIYGPKVSKLNESFVHLLLNESTD